MWNKVKRNRINNKPGLYAIYFQDILLYIGRSLNLYKRLNYFTHGKHQDIRFIYGTDNLTYKIKYTTNLELEGGLIKKISPKFNQKHNVNVNY